MVVPAKGVRPDPVLTRDSCLALHCFACDLALPQHGAEQLSFEMTSLNHPMIGIGRCVREQANQP